MNRGFQEQGSWKRGFRNRGAGKGDLGRWGLEKVRQEQGELGTWDQRGFRNMGAGKEELKNRRQEQESWKIGDRKRRFRDRGFRNMGARNRGSRGDLGKRYLGTGDTEGIQEKRNKKRRARKEQPGKEETG